MIASGKLFQSSVVGLKIRTTLWGYHYKRRYSEVEVTAIIVDAL